ncbi:hypothetical protein [Miniimonas sp. S16]|uniref:DUF6932 family protein n=1 Tax=Miniimonas sp. S16 TaxID=2171623 RepID=UPI000D52888E|nr:hypothetical protein [Miniimonas sp. S16]
MSTDDLRVTPVSRLPLRAQLVGELLRLGRHRASMAEVEEVFVVGAPFEAERRILWDAFKAYRSVALAHYPSARFWVNGGFVTHKTWAAPHDIDVCVVVPGAEVLAVGQAGEHLWTTPGPPRIQPMAGLVDGFLAVAEMLDDLNYWRSMWTSVTDSDGTADPGRRKGYLEVEP